MCDIRLHFSRQRKNNKYENSYQTIYYPSEDNVFHGNGLEPLVDIYEVTRRMTYGTGVNVRFVLISIDETLATRCKYRP